MERVSITERPDWREKPTNTVSIFTPCTASRTGVKMLLQVDLSQVEKLEEVTAELHQMCLKVVEK